jgi:hypothetical protein
MDLILDKVKTKKNMIYFVMVKDQKNDLDFWWFNPLTCLGVGIT